MNSRFGVSALALLAGLAVAAVSFGYGRELIRANVETEPVLVAARHIPAFAIVSESDLTWKTMPKGSRDPGAVQDPRSVAGRMTMQDIFPGQQIRREAVSEDTIRAAPGERLVAIPTNLMHSAGGLVRRGDVVDVYLTGSKDGGELLVAGAVVVSVRSASGQEIGAPAGGNVVSTLTDMGAAATGNAGDVPAMVILKVPTGQVAALGRAVAGSNAFLAKVGEQEAATMR